MRTHKKHGILIAGVNGFKIYSRNGSYRVVARYGFKDIEQNSYDESIVTRYSTLKYQPVKDRENIVNAFLELMKEVIV
jgi:hypothetical protein